VLLVGSAQELILEAAAVDPFQVPLLGSSGTDGSGHSESPVRVYGAVVASEGTGRGFCLEAEGVRYTVQPLREVRVQAGWWVEVAGYLVAGGSTRLLEDAAVRRLGHAPAAGEVPFQPNRIRGGSEESGRTPVLVKAKSVRALSEREAEQAYPIRLRAVVLYHDAGRSLLYVHDGEEGVSVELHGVEVDLRAGQWVNLEGVTGAGSYAPGVRQPRFQVLGQAPMPEPKATTAAELRAGALDSQWVQVSGVVRSVGYQDGRVLLDLAVPTGRLRAVVPDQQYQPVPRYLTDAEVRLDGVCGTRHNRRGQLTDVTLYVPDLGRVEVTSEPGNGADALEIQPIASLLRFDPEANHGRRVRVQGVVTLRRPGGVLWLQEENHGVRVFASRLEGVTEGDRADVVGFPAPGGATPVLECAEVKSLGRGKTPAAVPVTMLDIAKGLARGEMYDARLVTLEARLIETAPTPDGRLYHLQQGKDRFIQAHVARRGDGTSLPAPQPGSMLRLTGVCTVEADESDRIRSLSLELRDVADCVVLESPGWWTAQRLGMTFTLASLLALVGLAWVVTLQRRVRQQTRLIRERLEAQTAVERQFRLFLQNVPGAAFIKDRAGRYLFANNAWERQFAKPRTDWYGRTDADFWSEDVAQQFAESDRVALESERTVVKVLSGRGSDGEMRYWMAYKFAMNDAQGGRVLGGILLDITEQHRAGEALRQSQGLLAKAFHASPAAMTLSTRADGRVMNANESFVALVEGTHEEVVGRSWSELGIWEEEAVRERLASQAARGVEVRDIECRLRTRSGKARTVLASVETIELGEEPCLLWILHDETERQQLEAQLRQAQKMESVGRLAAGVAHDFNNMLTIIQGYVGLLQALLEDYDAVTEPLQQIACASDRAANLTRQLLMFSRRQLLEPQVLNLNDVIRNLSKMLQRMLGEDIALECALADQLPALLADPGMLEQVMMNLAVNARDAMPKGGQLCIRTEALTVEASHLRDNPQGRVGDFVCLSVIDTGCGMDPGVLSRIFEPFYTTKEVGKGTGLGLATVYGIVQQHHGWLEVQSDVGRGTAFRVYLPVHAGAPTEAARSTGMAVTAVGQGTVLLVEDEPALRGLASRVLEKSGYRVLQARSGPEALDIWRQHGERIDLLLTDMVMPEGIDGRELADRLTAEKPTLKVVYTSGYSPEAVAKGHRFERANFLPKPYSPAALTQTVATCLGRVSIGQILN